MQKMIATPIGKRTAGKEETEDLVSQVWSLVSFSAAKRRSHALNARSCPPPSVGFGWWAGRPRKKGGWAIA